jgi:hypothetical protein
MESTTPKKEKDIRYEYAYNLIGKPIVPSDARKDCKYSCVYCKNEMIVKQGEKNAWHFAHIVSPEDKCIGNKPNSQSANKEYDTALHNLAKNVLITLLEDKTVIIKRTCYRCFKIEETTFSHEKHTVFKEHKIQTGVADVVVEKDGKLFVFEVFNTHRTSERPDTWWCELDANDILTKNDKDDTVKINCIRKNLYCVEECQSMTDLAVELGFARPLEQIQTFVSRGDIFKEMGWYPTTSKFISPDVYKSFASRERCLHCCKKFNSFNCDFWADSANNEHALELDRSKSYLYVYCIQCREHLLNPSKPRLVFKKELTEDEIISSERWLEMRRMGTIRYKLEKIIQRTIVICKIEKYVNNIATNIQCGMITGIRKKCYKCFNNKVDTLSKFSAIESVFDRFRFIKDYWEDQTSSDDVPKIERFRDFKWIATLNISFPDKQLKKVLVGHLIGKEQYEKNSNVYIVSKFRDIESIPEDGVLQCVRNDRVCNGSNCFTFEQLALEFGLLNWVRRHPYDETKILWKNGTKTCMWLCHQAVIDTDLSSNFLSLQMCIKCKKHNENENYFCYYCLHQTKCELIEISPCEYDKQAVKNKYIFLFDIPPIAADNKQCVYCNKFFNRHLKPFTYFGARQICFNCVKKKVGYR